MVSSLHRLRPLSTATTLLLIATLAACSSGSSTSTSSSTTLAPKPAPVAATAGLVGVVSAGPPAALADADKVAVLHAVDAYVRAATIDPLAGKPGQLDALFATGAAPPATGPERDALSDDGLAQLNTDVKTTLAPVSMSGLADQVGAIDLVGTTLDLTVNGTAKRGAITIHRSGELMFVRDGDTWKITSFKLTVTRDGAGLGPAPSTTTGSSKP